MPINTLILGHSICRRLKDYLLAGIDSKHQPNLKLKNSSTVAWHGVGGRTIGKIMKYDMHMIKTMRPDCLVLLAGGNDITEETDVEEVASKIVSFCSILLNTCGVKHVVICALVPRFPATNISFRRHGFSCFDKRLKDKLYKNMYVFKAQKVNETIEEQVSNNPKISFWDHNRRFTFNGEKSRDKFISDGVHLNSKGQYHLYKSIMGAVINALGRMR